MESITEPGPTVRQMAGTDPDGGNILSVLAKRTYEWDASGRWSLVAEQPALIVEPRLDQADSRLLLDDTDLFPYKLATDVIVKGHAYPKPGQPSTRAGIQIGGVAKVVTVIGERSCLRGATGRLIFSEPNAVERVPLRYDLAYGGVDRVAEKKYGNPLDLLKPYLPPEIDPAQANPFAYPRNPSGRGYLIDDDPHAIEQLSLPLLEDPLDLLSPQRLVVGAVGAWTAAPLPEGFGWVDHSWFPRLAYLGMAPDHDPVSAPIAEVTRGLADANILADIPIIEKFSFRFTSGASLGLQLPHLRGDEECLLVNIYPHERRFVLRLPGDRPAIWTDGRKGKLNTTEPVLHTLVIEPEESRLTVVWRGSAPALRPYFDEELAKMPLRVEWA